MGPSSSAYVATITLTFSTILEKVWKSSSCSSWSSRSARSILFMKRMGRIRSAIACLRTVSVWTQTPDTQSTTTRAPSVTRRAAVTSEEKSTWPGESIKLIKNPHSSEPSAFLAFSCLQKARSLGSISKYMEMAVDLMVMHLSCSSFLVSVALVSPALEAAMMPALATRESVRVDLPWSTWAITDMFLMFLFLSIHDRTWSTVKLTILNFQRYGSLKY